MTIAKKQLSSGKMELNITITPDKCEKYLRGTALKLGEKIRVPGFRPGKAPYQLIKNQVGEMQLLQESLNKIVGETYAKAIKQEKLRPAMPPKITVQKIAPGNPIEYKAEIVVLPTVVLPQFSKIKVKAREISVKPEQIDEALQHLQKMQAKDRDNGKKGLPELNDAFASNVNPKFKDLPALKSQLEENIRLEQEFKEKQRQEKEIFAQLINLSKFDNIAPEILEDVKNQMVQEIRFNLERAGNKWEDYLTKIKKTEEDLKVEFRSHAEKRIKMDSIIAQVVDQENLAVQASEVKGEVNRFLQQFAPIGKAKGQINLPQLQASIKGRLLNRKAIEFIKSKVNS
jgi:FKBP-type peptidyl-prolyl cis-trans isomerase (trigger factor)